MSGSISSLPGISGTGDGAGVARLGVPLRAFDWRRCYSLAIGVSVLRDFVIALNLSDFLLNGGYLGAVAQQGVG